MRKIIRLIIGFFTALTCAAQDQNVYTANVPLTDFSYVDSLARLLKEKPDDASKVKLLGDLSFGYAFNKADSGLFYGQMGIELAKKIGDNAGRAYCTQSYSMALWSFGNYNTALQFALEALRQYEELGDIKGIAFTYYVLANVYRDFGDYDRALIDVYKGLGLSREIADYQRIGFAIAGSIHELKNELDSAQSYLQIAHDIDVRINNDLWGWKYTLLGNVQRKRNNYDQALTFYRKALTLVIRNNIPKDIVDINNALATLYKETGKVDSCIFYASEVIQKWSSVSYQKGVSDAANTLAAAYKIKNERDSSMKYLELSIALNNKLFNQEKERDIQNLAFKEQLRQDEIVRERAKFINQLKIYALLALGFVFLVIAVLLWRNNQHRKKAYGLLQKQKHETDSQKTKVEQTLLELKEAQAQLVQSEKMASLGELTAGIAHEIQNPLNFVNNFSEVNKELLAEMNDEIVRGNYSEAAAIAKNVIDNQEKINHHGKRADAIVKGMLQHSRTSSGQKEPTDINVLADEYLRLAYHGLRAKDKSFNAKFETDFDQSIEKINVVPQDIGRVILNLINNAFYSISEKQASAIPIAIGTAGQVFEPTVTISTKRVNHKPDSYRVEIRVKDNGNGIPQKVLDKIFQPFFTTKPTGQGTGLGLSLSFDIITKGHGGELKVETMEGKFSEFIIILPA